jgi:hypothetical protein
MAESCKKQQERVEETVLQPIAQWVEQQEEKCRNEPCIWWMLCLNKGVCWFVTALVKVTLWVTTVVVRWVYRIVCTVVSLVIGVLALVKGNTDILVQAVKDLWELTKDAIYTVIGAVIFAALRIVDIIQTIVQLQPAKRRLTEREREILWPIFRNSLNYNSIELVIGSAGLLSLFKGTAFTMGYTIYIQLYDEPTLVHECVHTWQFQFEGFKYIGNSALNQFDSRVFSPGYDPYDWKSHIDAGESWYTLKSGETQASFIEDVYALGRFVFSAPDVPANVEPGAFFREDKSLGKNMFNTGGVDYTNQANDAWRIIRTG